jgi:hypothetical protein
MLILPCMRWLSYGSRFEESNFWKPILTCLNPYLPFIDVYAIDCIRLPSTNKPIGIWSPYKDERIFQEVMSYGLDSYPAWAKFKGNPLLLDELQESVEVCLNPLASQYQTIIAYVNVRAYYECLTRVVKNGFRIIVLPTDISWRFPRKARSGRAIHELELAVRDELRLAQQSQRS